MDTIPAHRCGGSLGLQLDPVFRIIAKSRSELMKGTRAKRASFEELAEGIISLEVEYRVNRLGGYGPSSEVIYEAHPIGCPSTLVDNQGNATAAFTSNGSLDFEVKLEGGMAVHVLDGSFDTVEKREIGVPSSNVWLEITLAGDRHVASIVNPRANVNLVPDRIKIVKLGDPERAMWYCASFRPAGDVQIETAVRLALISTSVGPAITREVYVVHRGGREVSGNIWTYYNLHGTQRFVYNKQLWYDAGLPVTNTETVNVATVPYDDILQIKRVSSEVDNATAEEATCDYATFVGDTSVFSLMPEAMLQGGMLAGGAGGMLNRFATASISASRFSIRLGAGERAIVQQGLLYMDDERAIQRFCETSRCGRPAYRDMAQAFERAARDLVEHTPGAKEITGRLPTAGAAARAPYFEIRLPHERGVSEYANSVWTGVQELYERCRAHGTRLADGIELGTRDRGQDMWPKMKEDPGRVRSDLVHAMSFMVVTSDEPPNSAGRLTLAQKLHGMFPRQYPSRWDDRGEVVYNDNRPYADSPLWLIDSLNMYIRETGDSSVLLEEVGTVRLTDPDHPETSGMVGCDRKLPIVDVLFEVLASYRRHVEDSPYHLAQILYGDWCDPIDMFGTSAIGDPNTRGRGRGAQVRLSAHVFLCLVETIDTLESTKVKSALSKMHMGPRVEELKRFANELRQSIVRVAWEDGSPGSDFMAGFIDCIHELKQDGSHPNYGQGEIGYTLGSMSGKDFDGVNRRVLSTQAYCLEMLRIRRDYLEMIAGTEEMVGKLLHTMDNLFYDPQVGLPLFTAPIANDHRAVAYVGRMGVLPSGCAENGEYHHAQVFMHRFRLNIPGQADPVWEQLQPILSATRDDSIAGPFDMPSNSYVVDRADPHFGKGMYFGLSGSVDWLVEVFQTIAGLELALHDPSEPDVRICPKLPKEICETLTFQRVIHVAQPDGGYRGVPLTVDIERSGDGERLSDTLIRVNGRRQESAEVWDLTGVKELNVEIAYVYH
jgi:hypothetical protein